jgi:hypothetical protein
VRTGILSATTSAISPSISSTTLTSSTSERTGILSATTSAITPSLSATTLYGTLSGINNTTPLLKGYSGPDSSPSGDTIIFQDGGGAGWDITHAQGPDEIHFRGGNSTVSVKIPLNPISSTTTGSAWFKNKIL